MDITNSTLRNIDARSGMRKRATVNALYNAPYSAQLEFDPNGGDARTPAV
jgi:hypothetical protein